MTQRSLFHLNCLLLALFTPKAEQRVYGQRGRATVVALIHVTEGNTSHRHSENISSATGSQQGDEQVTKRCGVCGMGTWEWRESKHTAFFIVTSGGIRLRDSQPVVTFHYIVLLLGLQWSDFIFTPERE